MSDHSETTTTRRIGSNRGKARLWIEGAFLSAAGWACGTRYNCRFEEGQIVYEQHPNGKRKVAGTPERPIIDTNTDQILSSVRPKPENPVARIVTKGKRIVVRAALLAIGTVTFGFFPSHAKTIVVGCEFSGIVRDAFAEKGHDAISCDLLDTQRPSGTHHRGDVLELLTRRQWDMALFFPPCTYLCSSGAWRCHPKHDPHGIRLAKQVAAVEFVKALWAFTIPEVCLENPIGVLSTQWMKPTQIVQPWQFGHGETKATCLWLRGLPPLQPTNIVGGRQQRVWKMSPSPYRARERSRTYVGIALAMAAQWG